MYCVDPGETTGVFWGVVNLAGVGTAVEVLAGRYEWDQYEVTAGKGRAAWVETGIEVARDFVEVRRRLGLGGVEVELVVEDFALRAGVGLGAEVISAVWVTGVLLGCLVGRVPVAWQQPGDRERERGRLRAAGVWARGLPHARDAGAHALTRVRRARQERGISL